MKLLAALLLSVPAFSSVLYDVGAGTDTGWAAVVPDFLPIMNPDQRFWTFEPPELTREDCNAIPGFSFCDGASLGLEAGNAVARLKSYDTHGFEFTMLEEFYPGVTLKDSGTFISTRGIPLTITQSSIPPTVAPEPRSILLFASGLLLVGMKYSRRLFDSALNLKEVIGFRR